MYKVRFSVDFFNGNNGKMEQTYEWIGIWDGVISRVKSEKITKYHKRICFEAKSEKLFIIVVKTKGLGIYENQNNKIEVFCPQNDKDNAIIISLKQGEVTGSPAQDTQPDISIRMD